MMMQTKNTDNGQNMALQICSALFITIELNLLPTTNSLATTHPVAQATNMY
jgi:hypothetical protein